VDFKGRLKVAGERGEGIPIVLHLDDIFLSLASEGESLGTWRIDGVDVERLHGSEFSLELDGERMVFVATDPLAFAYTGVSYIEDITDRLTKRWAIFRRKRPAASAGEPLDVEADDFEPPAAPEPVFEEADRGDLPAEEVTAEDATTGFGYEVVEELPGAGFDFADSTIDAHEMAVPSGPEPIQPAPIQPEPEPVEGEAEPAVEVFEPAVEVFEPEPEPLEPEPLEPEPLEPEPVQSEPEPPEAESEPLEPEPLEPEPLEPEPLEPEPVQSEPEPPEAESEPVEPAAQVLEPEPVQQEPESVEAAVAEAPPESSEAAAARAVIEAGRVSSSPVEEAGGRLGRRKRPKKKVSSGDHEHDYQESRTVGGITRRVCSQCGHVSFLGEDVYQEWR
jgi:hypothetical protein